MNNTSKAQLIKGPISKLLIKKTLPMVFGITGMVAFNLVDAFFIGKLGKEHLAAIGIVMPVIMILNGLAFGVGQGAAAILSRAIGKGDEEEVKRLTTDSLVLAVLLVGIFVIFGFFSMDIIFPLIGAEGQVLVHVKEYMSIWYAGAIFVVIPMVGNNAIRATGDTMTTSIIMLTAVVVNIILDPLLIFGIGPFPRMEIEGAALATVIARAVTFVFAIWALYFRDKMITLTHPGLDRVFKSWKKILYIGVPQSANYIILPIGVGIINSFVAGYGSAAIAGLTSVSLRIDFFAMSIIMALGSALGPIVGQNWGAEKFDRVQQAIKYSLIFSVLWGGFAAIVMGILSGNIGPLFNDNPKVIEIVKDYMLIVPVSYGLISILMLAVVILNVLNKPFHASALTFMRVLVLYIPLTYLGSELFQLNGLIGGISAANIICGIISYITLTKIVKSERGRLEKSVEQPAVV